MVAKFIFAESHRKIKIPWQAKNLKLFLKVIRILVQTCNARVDIYKKKKKCWNVKDFCKIRVDVPYFV